MIPVEAAERIGCDVHAPASTIRIVTASGIIISPVVKLSRFNCLGAEFKNFPVVAHTLPSGTFVDGLLGMDFLNHVGAVIDIQRRAVRSRS